MSFWFHEQSFSQLLGAAKEIAATPTLTTAASSILNNSSHNATIVS